MNRLIAIFLVSLLSCALCRAEDAGMPPTAEQLAQAQARGKAVRNQTALLPTALMKTAVLLKVEGVRCGHAQVKIEDAKGDGGGTYRLIERLKAVMPAVTGGAELEVIEYTGSLLLNADLSLLSGKQVTTRSVSSGKASEKETLSADISVAGDELNWTVKEQRGDDPALDTKADPVKLHGVRPVPRNAIIALAAFASAEPGFKAGISSPLLVPTMDMGKTIDTFMLQSAWLSFELPKDKTNTEAKMLMTVRLLDAEIDEKGLKMEPPAVETWEDTMIWAFDEKLNVVGLPSPGDSTIETERVNADKLDLGVALDFDKIKAAIRKADDKKHKDIERITKVPLK